MLDRLDRLALAGLAPRADASAASTPAVSSRELAGTPARSVVPTSSEVDHITSKRGARFVDYTACPLCGFDRVGLAYQGTLRSGAKVHELGAHSPGAGRVIPRSTRCMASGMRMTFVAAGWVSEVTP